MTPGSDLFKNPSKLDFAPRVGVAWSPFGGRNTTINLSNPNDPVTATNLPFDANGNLIVSRSLPRGAGFGVANAYQPARNMQVQVRFSF